MKVFAYESFQDCYSNLPDSIQKKTDKQIRLLSGNFYHPSLHTKRVRGTRDIWEARVDYHYRMTFEVREHAIYLRAVGNHDEVLKNP